MNEAQKHYIQTAEKFKGVKIGSAKHKDIVAAFNLVKPDGWAMNYTAPWCATSASAWAIMAFGQKLAKKYFPLSANCGTIIEKAKRMGIWVESDRWVPNVGSWLLYDWNDSGAGDNKGVPDHVGVCCQIDGNRITVIEGNKGTPGVVGLRSVVVNGRYIRGYVAIDWSALNKEWTASKEKTTGKKPKAKYQTGTYTVTASNGLNYRKGPGTSYAKIGAVGKGTRIKITKISGSWGYSPKLGGWLCLDYTKKN